MDNGLFVTFVGITVAGLAGILGVWMERDRLAPVRWAFVFTALIVISTGLKVAHSISQTTADAATEDAMVRVLERLAVLAESGEHPAIEPFVGAELARQSSSNPEVIERLQQRVAAKGGDPAALRRKAFEGGRAAAGLPARSKATKAAVAKVEAEVEAKVDELGEEAATKVGEAAEELGVELGIPKLPDVLGGGKSKADKAKVEKADKKR